MLLLLDTCFCSHCEELFLNDIFDIRPLLLKFKIAITNYGKKELMHFGLNKFLNLEDILIIDTETLNLEIYRKNNEFIDALDKPDQLLWIIAYKNKEEDYIVLTDDGELLLNCQISKLSAMRLPTFLIFLGKLNYLSKNQIAKCLKFWEKIGRFKKQELKKWNYELQQMI